MLNYIRSRLPLSIIVVIYNMAREAPRTLYSLSPQYQQGVVENDYEVIVVDNGSFPRFPVDSLNVVGKNFSYYYINNASPSPAYAVNFGVSQARGTYVGIMIDGARIVSPGIIHHALRAFQAYHNPVVATLGWHLGPTIQRVAVATHGYTTEMEDRALENINWTTHGYRLFQIASLAGSSDQGWFRPMSESSLLYMPMSMFERFGGCDERFDKPGGGLANLDMYKRACELPDVELIILLGEGSFHQMHGGAMTSATEQECQERLKEWGEQYITIRKAPFSLPEKTPKYIGHMPPEALESLLTSAKKACDGLMPASAR